MSDKLTRLPLRIDAGVDRGPQITLTVNGEVLAAHAGESLAAVLFAAGWRRLRASPRARTPRGMFCLMGACQECMVGVDGRRVLACQEPVRQGMQVHTDVAA